MPHIIANLKRRLSELLDVTVGATPGWLHWDGSAGTVSTPSAADVGADAAGTAAGLVSTEATARAGVQSNLDTHAGLSTTAHGGIVASTDARLTDARTPLAHAASHGTGQSDAVTPAAIGAATASHTHAEADVTSLVTDLAGKAAVEVASRWPLATGYWYVAQSPALTTGTPGNGAVLCAPVVISRACTVDQMAVEITTVGGTGSVIRLGIYNTVAGLPGTVVADAGTVIGTSQQVQVISSLNIALTPGLYWLAAVNQGGASPAATLRANGSPTGGIGSTTTDIITSAGAGYLIGTGVTGALQAASSPSRQTSAPRVAIHISA